MEFTSVTIKTEIKEEPDFEAIIKTEEDLDIKEDFEINDYSVEEESQPSTSDHSLIDDVRKPQKRKFAEISQVDGFQQHTKRLLGVIGESLEGMHLELKKISGALTKIIKK